MIHRVRPRPSRFTRLRRNYHTRALMRRLASRASRRKRATMTFYIQEYAS